MNQPDYTIYTESLEEGARVRELLYAFQRNFEGFEDWQAGSAEPWISTLVGTLLMANDTRNAIEIGGFMGFTSRLLKDALSLLPHPTTLTVCEIDSERAEYVRKALDSVDGPNVQTNVHIGDSLAWIPTLSSASIDFAWLDGNHEKGHVAREIALLWPKMAPGGLIVGHDVFGVCDLQEVFKHMGGYALDLPRLGPAGGIGILQRPR